MALVQKLKVDYLTFGEIPDKILSRVLREGEGSNRVDVVFDVYRDISIKSVERELRGDKFQEPCGWPEGQAIQEFFTQW